VTIVIPHPEGEAQFAIWAASMLLTICERSEVSAEQDRKRTHLGGSTPTRRTNKRAGHSARLANTQIFSGPIVDFLADRPSGVPPELRGGLNPFT